MAQQIEVHNFQGMVKDLKESLMEPKYYLDAHNIRITTREDNPQQFIITNEKGTIKYPITVIGTILGYCVVSHYLVSFSTTRDTSNKGVDYIYRIDLDKIKSLQSVGDTSIVKLFEGDLDFRIDKPIETLGSYEDRLICKVYWTDNYNQPRLINILKPELKGYDVSSTDFPQNVKKLYTPDSFNFIRELQLNEVVTVERVEGGSGAFSAGTIQYAFTYYNKYEQETNIFYVTPLYYISFPDRGGNAEDQVSNCFKITVNNIDLNFEYLRIYSIHRTSKNATPLVKRVADINISNFKNNEDNAPFYRDYFDVVGDNSGVMPAAGSDIKQHNTGYFVSHAESVSVNYVLDDKTYTKYFKDNNFRVILEELGIVKHCQTYVKNGWGDTGECLYGSLVQYYVINPILDDKQIAKYKEYVNNNVIDWFPNYQGSDEEIRKKLESFISTFQFNIENYNFIFNKISDTKYDNIYIIKQYITGGGALKDCSPFMGICTNNGSKLFYTTNPITPSSSSSDPSYYRVILTDTGMIGDNIDPDRLLYVGGEELKVETLDQKDGTLFLGNLTITRPSVRSIKVDNTSIEKYLQANKQIVSGVRQVSHTISIPNQVNTESDNSDSYDYIYKNQLYTNTSGFKSNEYYRLGIQFQYKTGKWSDPVYIDDVKQNSLPQLKNYSEYGIQYIKQLIPTFIYTLPRKVVNILYDCGYRKARGVVVFPSLEERSIVAQGVINPTMYTKKKRETSLYAQSSWFFRPIYTGNSHIIGGDGSINDLYRFGHRTEEELSPALEKLLSDDSADATLKSKTGGVIIASYDKDHATKLKYVGNNFKNRQGDNEGNSTDEQYETFAGDIPTRDVEIQGCFSRNNQFYIDWSFLTFHSPDIQFDDQLYYQDFNHIKARQIGTATVNATYSDIQLVTKTGPVNTFASGFDHRSFIFKNGAQLCSGLFYEDGLVNENKKTGLYKNASEYFGNEPFRFMVYPFQGKGALNNDSDRAGEGGEGTSKLQTKMMSNLRICDSKLNTDAYKDITDTNNLQLLHTMQLDYSTETQILKFDNKVYQSNIDTLLVPDYRDGNYFISGKLDSSKLSLLSQALIATTKNPGSIGTVQEDFKNHTSASFYQDLYWHKTWDWSQLDLDTDDPKFCIQSWVSGALGGTKVTGWVTSNTGSQIGDADVELTMKKSPVLMKYKSTPHMVLPLTEAITPIDFKEENTGRAYLPIVELYRDYENDTDYFSKDNLFGGKTEDALKANQWLPASDPTNLVKGQDIEVVYKYGDTWYQRFDCLKTYAFTKEDQNQIVDILSFPCESRVNTDGRYDRNRGQKDNTTMSPTNFNLLNDVYSQQDNYFTYRILDDDYYNIDHFPNQFTWTLEKHSAEVIDPWTNITLASTFDVDGAKGEIRKIDNWSGNLVCFQDRYISKINFNAQVQLETVQGTPIEVVNSKRVNGTQSVGDNIGSINKFSICNSANCIFFVDTMTNNLWKVEGIQQLQVQPISIGTLSTWFNIQSNKYWSPINWGNSMKLYYDESKKDLYVVTDKECLCFNTSINAFTSFYPYSSTNCLFNYNDKLFSFNTENNTSILYGLCIGEYNSFFGSYQPYDITLLSNGYSSQQPHVIDDKTFDILETRSDYYLNQGNNYILQDDMFPFDTIQVYNNYQDSTEVRLQYKKILPSNLKKKFRIWKIQIPRDKNSSKSKDRIRDVWCKIKLKADEQPQNKDFRIEMNDAIVKFFV